MNLEISERERDVLMTGISTVLGSAISGDRDVAFDLIKRLARLEPDPDVPFMDYSNPGQIYCAACDVRATYEEFAHRPGCAWVKRYG